MYCGMENFRRHEILAIFAVGLIPRKYSQYLLCARVPARDQHLRKFYPRIISPKRCSGGASANIFEHKDLLSCGIFAPFAVLSPAAPAHN